MDKKLLDLIKDLSTANDLAEAGREVGRAIRDRTAVNSLPTRADRRAQGLRRKKKGMIFPMSPDEFLQNGGMREIEYQVGMKARDEAVQSEREYWLPRLEEWHANETIDLIRHFLGEEIKRLRLGLHVKQTPEQTREQTRNRVRKHRERKRLKAKNAV